MQMVISGGYSNDRHIGMLRLETLTELTDILSRFFLGMNHDTVGTTLFHVSTATLQRIVYAFTGNQTFTTGYNHEVLCHLGILAGTYFLAEILDTVLSLYGVCTKQGILLQSHLILNNNSRDAIAL